MQAAANSGAVPTMEFRGVVVEGGIVLRQWRCAEAAICLPFPTSQRVVDSTCSPCFSRIVRGCWSSEKMITTCEKYGVCVCVSTTDFDVHLVGIPVIALW